MRRHSFPSKVSTEGISRKFIADNGIIGTLETWDCSALIIAPHFHSAEVLFYVFNLWRSYRVFMALEAYSETLWIRKRSEGKKRRKSTGLVAKQSILNSRQCACEIAAIIYCQWFIELSCNLLRSSRPWIPRQKCCYLLSIFMYNKKILQWLSSLAAAVKATHLESLSQHPNVHVGIYFRRYTLGNASPSRLRMNESR